ncbi:UDP-3-O-[3-hydroxymyristoyl] N-acetylglucosamine deacetylase [Acetobacteraceae bacterium]|nr:UDP-3-O-[3-hydroxymyristoyl] N-acetylglucosamine deacetylase [Acetobacteraceae bacterium]
MAKLKNLFGEPPFYMPFPSSPNLPSSFQSTIEKGFSFSGESLHSGQKCEVSLAPSKENTGIRFYNTDYPEHGFFSLSPACLLPGNLATIIAHPEHPEARISTTEHFLAALRAFELDNLDITVSGGEIPIQDGCAAFFSQKLAQAGRKELPAKRKWIKILQEVHIAHEGAETALFPSEYPQFQIEIDFPAPAIGKQGMSCFLDADFFTKEIAPARTFVNADQLEQLRQMGLIKGGTLDNALVVDGDKIVNPEGTRYPNEFARHKLLDAIGDLYCAGLPILGRFSGKKSGHNINRMLLQKLFSDSHNYEIVEAPPLYLPSSLKD